MPRNSDESPEWPDEDSLDLADLIQQLELHEEAEDELNKEED